MPEKLFYENLDRLMFPIEKGVENPLRDYKEGMIDSDFPARLSLIKLYEISSFLQKHLLLTQKIFINDALFWKYSSFNQIFHFEMFSQCFIYHFVAREILYRMAYNSWGFVLTMTRKLFEKIREFNFRMDKVWCDQSSWNFCQKDISSRPLTAKNFSSQGSTEVKNHFCGGGGLNPSSILRMLNWIFSQCFIYHFVAREILHRMV